MVILLLRRLSLITTSTLSLCYLYLPKVSWLFLFDSRLFLLIPMNIYYSFHKLYSSSIWLDIYLKVIILPINFILSSKLFPPNLKVINLPINFILSSKLFPPNIQHLQTKGHFWFLKNWGKQHIAQRIILKLYFSLVKSVKYYFI